MESKLAEEGYVGYIDLNCIVNNNGIYPLEFTSRFGYPTISIQQEGMLTPISDFFWELATGVEPKWRTRSGFQIGIRIVVPPFPFDDDATFESFSKNNAIVFKKPVTEGIHIEDVKVVNGQWLIAGTSGVVLVVVGTGQTMKQAQARSIPASRTSSSPTCTTAPTSATAGQRTPTNSTTGAIYAEVPACCLLQHCRAALGLPRFPQFRFAQDSWNIFGIPVVLDERQGVSFCCRLQPSLDGDSL